jgi:thioredoxin reductase
VISRQRFWSGIIGAFVAGMIAHVYAARYWVQTEVIPTVIEARELVRTTRMEMLRELSECKVTAARLMECEKLSEGAP